MRETEIQTDERGERQAEREKRETEWQVNRKAE